MGKMSKKKQAFSLEYTKDWNATQAAIRAGYSPKTAKSQGQRLLTKVDVQKKIDDIIDQALGTQREQIKYRVLDELQNLAFINLSDHKYKKGCPKIKYQDKVKALELLGKYGALFTDKETGDQIINIIVGKDDESVL